MGFRRWQLLVAAILRDTLDDRRRAKVLSLLNGITCITLRPGAGAGHLIMLKYPRQSLFYTMTGMGVMVAVLSVLSRVNAADGASAGSVTAA